MLKAYKYQIFPSEEQRVLIEKHFGCCRWVYNYALSKKIEAYKSEGKSLSRFAIQGELPLLKKSEETKWLSEVTAHPLQACLADLESAYKNGKLAHKIFDFAEVNGGRVDINGCGTIGCALGECPEVFPSDWKFFQNSDDYQWEPTIPSCRNLFDPPFNSAEEYFSLSEDEVRHLFAPLQQCPHVFGGKVLEPDATREEVAQNLYAFISIKKNNRNDN